MKNKLLTISLLLSSVNIYAEKNFISVSAGMMANNRISNNDSRGQFSANQNAVINLGYGVHITKTFLAEAALFYTPTTKYTAKNNNQKLTTNLSSYGGMLNFYNEMPGYTADFTPYFMAGFGIAFNNLDKTKIHQNNQLDKSYRNKVQNSFAWQVGGGFNFKPSYRTCLDLGYRYRDLGQAKSSQKIQAGPANSDGKINGENYMGTTQSFKKIVSHDIVFTLKYYLN